KLPCQPLWVDAKAHPQAPRPAAWSAPGMAGQRRLGAGRHPDAPRGAPDPARRTNRIWGGGTGRSLDRQIDENCRKSSPPPQDIFISDPYQSSYLQKKRYFKKR
ncbi:MAG: hypothetical protein LW703_11810, partial [Rhodobacter sp.]|nr:hypothetical protein [Rhodobacter sp.]